MGMKPAPSYCFRLTAKCKGVMPFPVVGSSTMSCGVKSKASRTGASGTLRAQQTVKKDHPSRVLRVPCALHQPASNTVRDDVIARLLEGAGKAWEAEGRQYGKRGTSGEEEEEEEEEVVRKVVGRWQRGREGGVEVVAK